MKGEASDGSVIFGGSGGGIHNYSATLFLYGGKATKNSATVVGGGSFIFEGTYTSTSVITGNKAKHEPHVPAIRDYAMTANTE